MKVKRSLMRGVLSVAAMLSSQVASAIDGPAVLDPSSLDRDARGALLTDSWSERFGASFSDSSFPTLSLERSEIDGVEMPPDLANRFEDDGWHVRRSWTLEASSADRGPVGGLLVEESRVRIGFMLSDEQVAAADGVASVANFVVSMASTNAEGAVRHTVGIVSELRLDDGGILVKFSPCISADDSVAGERLVQSLGLMLASTPSDYPPRFPGMDEPGLPSNNPLNPDNLNDCLRQWLAMRAEARREMEACSARALANAGVCLAQCQFLPPTHSPSSQDCQQLCFEQLSESLLRCAQEAADMALFADAVFRLCVDRLLNPNPPRWP